MGSSAAEIIVGIWNAEVSSQIVYRYIQLDLKWIFKPTRLKVKYYAYICMWMDTVIGPVN